MAPVTRSAAILICVIACSLLASAQTGERDQARMAQAYERSGDVRNAARIYQELYAASPSNVLYFEGVVRTLQALDQLPSLYPIIVQHAQRVQNVPTLILAGTLAAKLGKSAERDEYWKKVRDVGGDDESVLVALGRAQTGVFLFADALTTYRDARKQNGSSTAYQDEIIVCLVATAKIEQAVDEALAGYDDELDLPNVIKRLSAVLANEGSAQFLDARLSKGEQSRPLLRLSLWFYRQQKMWSKAMKAAVALDDASANPGSELLSYADGARADEEYNVAIEAYRNVMNRTKDQRIQTSAAYGSVRALEQRLRASASMDVGEARNIVASYDDVIRRFSQHPLTADALYYSALILDDVIRDVDDAQRRLLRITSFWKGASVAPDAAMRLADIYLAQGADSAARAQLLLVQDMRGGVASEKLDVARLKLADMDLWSGNVDSASAQYSMIAADPSSIAANDAIDRLLLLQLQQDDSTGVSAIIKAEQYFQRRQFAKAIDVLATQLASTKDQDLKDRGTFLAARSCIVMGDTLKAEPFLLAILQRIPESIYGDKALWLLASVSEFKTDIKSAMQYLESLLMNYPRSILIPDTRERIRKLRGDA